MADVTERTLIAELRTIDAKLDRLADHVREALGGR